VTASQEFLISAHGVTESGGHQAVTSWFARCRCLTHTQALPLLQARFPIERARMRLRVVVPVEHRQELEDKLLGGGRSQTEMADIQGPNFTLTTQVWRQAGGLCWE
jgi:hypothetical protein